MFRCLASISFLLFIILVTGEEALKIDSSNDEFSNLQKFAASSSPSFGFWNEIFPSMNDFSEFFIPPIFGVQQPMRFKFPSFVGGGSGSAAKIGFDTEKCLMSIDLSGVEKNSNVKVDMVDKSVRVKISSKISEGSQDSNSNFLFRSSGASMSESRHSVR